MEAKYECGFFAVNRKHCIIKDHCIVCKIPSEPKLEKGQEIEFKNFGELDGRYLIADVKGGTLKLEFLK